MNHPTRRAVLVLAATAVAVGAGVPSAQAGVADCKGFEMGAFVYDFSVRNMSCPHGRNLIRRSFSYTKGFTFRAAREDGFRCRKIGAVYEGTTYRCTRGRKAFRFTYGS